MFEISFLPCKGDNPDSTKSSDAIVICLYLEEESREALIVIDAGFSKVGDDVVNHIRSYYDTDEIDLMISTHPDSDHINGLVYAIQQLKVKELLVHQPHLHFTDADKISNNESIEDLQAFAIENGTVITEPFTGLVRFGGKLTILGPTQEHYEHFMQQHIDEENSERRANESLASNLFQSVTETAERVLPMMPIETLGDNNSTGPRNETSVITLLRTDGKSLLFTGDAGPEGLEKANDFYEFTVGSYSQNPLYVFQIPHHGSRHNLNQSTLDRMLGPKNDHYSDEVTAVISASKKSKKHPAAKVTNALIRRGVKKNQIGTTEGKLIVHHHGYPSRPNMSPIEPYPIRPE